MLVLALWLFTVVHVDTFLVMIAFCTDERYRLPEIVVGHYLGFGVGLVGAIGGALLAAEVLEGTAFMLGLLPLALGAISLFCRRPVLDSGTCQPAPGPWRRVGIVTAVGVGLSGENIAVFVPFFVVLTPGEFAVIAVLYLAAPGIVLGAAWIVAARMQRMPIPVWVETLLVPATLIAVGLYVLLAGWIAA